MSYPSSDVKDTLKRLRHVGRLFNLDEDSKFVKLADAILSLERGG